LADELHWIAARIDRFITENGKRLTRIWSEQASVHLTEWNFGDCRCWCVGF
jgi:hypothetical protein